MAKIITYEVEGTLEDYTVLRENNTVSATDKDEAVFLLNQEAMEYKKSGAEVVFTSADRFFLINESDRVYRMVDAFE